MKKFLEKVSQYGIKESFYRGLHRIAFYLSKIHPYFLFRKYIYGYAIIDVNNVKMHLDLKNDDGISKELLTLGKREPVTVDFLLDSHLLKEGGMALDIGANIGYYALLESKLVGNSGRVYAIEPVSKNLAILNKNVALNGFSNIETYHLAIGNEENKEASIYARSKGNLSSFTSIPSDSDERIVKTEKVRLVTADSFVRENMKRVPDFIRMDVEGYEFEILKGMSQMLEISPSLLIEFHPMILTDTQKEWICELLKKYYSQVVVTVNPKGKIDRFTRYLNRKMGEELKREGIVEKGNIETLRKHLFSSNRVFNTFIYNP
ncbi:MAG: FkbM family methyltransferase [bacterium]|nr:FkbM family methyltransferase [bacterium]